MSIECYEEPSHRRKRWRFSADLLHLLSATPVPIGIGLVVFFAAPIADYTGQCSSHGVCDALSLSVLDPQSLYPNASLSQIENASHLAESIFMSFGQQLAGESAPESPDVNVGRLFYRVVPPFGMIDLPQDPDQVVAFSSTNGSSVHIYYDSPANGGLFVTFAVSLNGSGIFASQTPPWEPVYPPEDNSSKVDPLEAVGWDIAKRFGIPTENRAGWGHFSNFTMWNTTSVVMCDSWFTDYGWIPFVGFNMLAVTFDDRTRELVEVQVRPFFDKHPQLLIDFREAMAIGDEFVNRSILKPNEMIFTSELVGLRYAPAKERIAFGLEYYAYVGDPVACNYTYEVTDYGWHMSFDAWSNVLVLIDAETGDILGYGSDLVREAGHWLISNSWTILGVAVFMAIPIAVIAVISLSPESGMAMFSALVVPLWLRLRGANILDNFNRGRIYGHINATPGVSFTDLRSALNIGNGNLAYHLMVLEKLELIRSVKEGRVRRFYPQGVSERIGRDQCLGKTEARILDELTANGPMTISHLAEAMGMSRQRIHYNIRLLDRRGLTECEGSAWRAVAPVHEGNVV